MVNGRRPDGGKAGTVHGIDLGAVEQAVRAAEQRTSGEIRVALARFYFWGDVRRAAERAFFRLGIDRTRERNGVLIFVAPWRRRFAILGDVGIHQRVPPRFWDGLAEPLGQAFRAGDLSGGLAHTIAVIGDRLAIEFPVTPDGAAGGAAGPPANAPSAPANARGPAADNQLPDSVALPGERTRR